MGRELTRQSAQEAFRFWAYVDRISAHYPGLELIPDITDRYRALLMADIQRPDPGGIRGSWVSKPTEAQLLRHEKLMENATSTIQDLEAVGRTLHWITGQRDGADVMEALREVYMEEPQICFERHTVRDRALAFSLKKPWSLRVVYKRLRKARIRWATERGLKIWEYNAKKGGI